MAWYTASAILAFEYKEGEQKSFPVWENSYLIEAKDEDEALEKAILIAKEEEGDDSGSLTVNGVAAKKVFMGIRKLISIVNLHDDDIPTNGAELSFSEYEVSNKSDLRNLAQGKEVAVKYVE